ncbi:protein crumbs-like [Xenia sp. Carnegie-2017]|uniref:protein crumbs-like n=1 Tax=Xenia sp. Carnegie-2017 TaxID=2897299 RepID=UPI001F04E13B|nr:protein crumbs-like [Xenia sp. Carnegie-2017]
MNTISLKSIYFVTLLNFVVRSQTEFLSFNKTSVEAGPLELTQDFELSFRTCNGGTLLRQGGNDSFFELEVLPGRGIKEMNFTISSLAVRWQVSGKPNISMVTLGMGLDQNKPYMIRFTPHINNATISVSLGEEASQVTLPGEIFNVSSEKLILGQNFIGCIDFGKRFNLTNASNGPMKNCHLNSGERCVRVPCQLGFKGFYCEENINECASHPCHHASTCVDGFNNYTCHCGRAWYGRNCDQLKEERLCKSIMCANGGICRHISNFNNYTCDCVPPYTGINCTEELNPCASSPCLNNGNCSNIGKEEDFECNCSRGFRGKTCDVNVDDCAIADCGTGKCVDLIANHSCNCTGTGFIGNECEIDINECDDSPCMNRGNCSNFAGGYLCTCDGYKGKNCAIDIDECENDKMLCGNNGTCLNTNGSFYCKCDKGFTGKYCNEDVTLCNPNPCKNDGICHNSTVNSTSESGNSSFIVANYTCMCQPGWRGRNCTEDIDECRENIAPCNASNNGSCINTIGGFECECLPGYDGIPCVDIDECLNNKTCNEQGTCENRIPQENGEKFKCSCFNGFSGDTCEIDVNECVDQRIGMFHTRCNNGTCINGPGYFTCNCYRGWMGEFCDVDIDECNVGGYCQNFVRCDNTLGNYSCICEDGFNGFNCTNDIDECELYQPCNTTGAKRCIDSVNNYTCICREGYTGRNCSEDVNECETERPCMNSSDCINMYGTYRCVCNETFTGRNCDIILNPCDTLSPCDNNAICNVTSDYNYTCTCTEGFAGRQCKNSTIVGFDGTSSMTVDISEAPSNISFSFQTIFANGVLVSQSGLWTLFLTNGQIRLTCDTVLTMCNVLGDLNEFTDSNWHQVSVNLNGSLISVHVDSNESCSLTCLSSSRRRRNADTSKQLVVGAGGDNLPNFIGSIRDFAVDDRKYYPGVDEVISKGVVSGHDRQEVCSPNPCVNGECIDLWTRYSCKCFRNVTKINCSDCLSPCSGQCQHLYGGENCEYYGCISEATFHQSLVHFTNSSQLSEITNLLVQFRTRQNNTVILSSVHNVSYFLILIQNGRVVVRYKFSDNATGNVSIDGVVSDGNWYELKISSQSSVTHFNISTLNHTNFAFTRRVSSKYQNILLLNKDLTNLIADGGVYVGSSPAMNTFHDDFSGCIREVKLGENLLTFFSPATLNSTQAKTAFSIEKRVNISNGCHSRNLCNTTEPPCNNGRCIPDWNTFTCECPDGYRGKQCQIDPCTDSPCVHGSCSVRGSSYECTCNNSYVGDICNETCYEAYCQNGGRNCSEDIKECQRTEPRCTENRSNQWPCAPLNPCDNNGICNVTSDCNYTCTCTEGFAGRQCKNSTVLGFDGRSSMTVNISSEISNVSLSFRTIFPNGVLVSQSSLWTLFLTSGQIRLTCGEMCNISGGPNEFTDSNWHQVSINLNGSTIFVHVDSNQSCSITNCLSSSRRRRDADTSKQLVVGAGGGNLPNFIGSIRDFTANDIKYYPNAPRVDSNGVESGYERRNVCFSNPCMNGKCVDLWTRYSCECDGNYTGINCSECSVGDICNETCYEGYCQNGGECVIAGTQRTCNCPSNWTGMLCGTPLPRDDDDDDDLPLIIGASVGGGVLLLFIIVVLCICTRKSSSSFGVYSPRSEEKTGAKLEMNSVLNAPPPEILI